MDEQDAVEKGGTELSSILAEASMRAGAGSAEHRKQARVRVRGSNCTWMGG